MHRHNNFTRSRRELAVDSDADDESSLGVLTADDMDRYLTDFAQLAGSASKSNHGTHYEPPHANPTQSNWRANKCESLNLSDLLENDTIDARSMLDTPTHQKRSVQMFQPSEITGRSTECMNAGVMSEQEVGTCSSNSPSVEHILATSFSLDVRSMADQLRDLKVRKSYGGRTADMSMMSVESSTATQSNSMFDWGDGYRNNLSTLSARLDAEEASFNATKVNEIIARGEKEWDAEYATIPNQSMNIVQDGTANAMRKPADTSDFYGNHYVPPSTERDFSIGQYFQRRCEDVAEMIPHMSPKKKHSIYGLIEQPASNHKYTKGAPQHKSIMSVSQIASHLDNQSSSPRTLANKLLNETKAQSEADERIENTADDNDTLEAVTDDNAEPLADILYITKPLPLSTNTTANLPSSSSVKILKVEEFIGDTKGLLKIATKMPISERHLQNKYSELTPNKHHIIAKSQRANDMVNKENIAIHLSDTVSCTESMWETDHHTERIAQPEFKVEESKSPMPDSRKRTRQSPHRSPGIAEVVELPAPQSPIDHKYPPLMIDGKTHVLQSKSRLTAADTKSQRNYRPLCLPFVSNEYHTRDRACRTPSPNLDRLTSSPRLCSSKSEGTSSSSVTQLDVGPNRERVRSASPTLLMQCSSQCSGSTNDLQHGGVRHSDIAALKSSHAEVCWESVKLRKTTTKSFTIKNMSHRKLSLKMEIVGPGFQITGTEASCQLGLQAHECRTICVTFCPTMIGPAYGNVCFYSAREIDERRHVRVVRLVGFGGNTTMALQELCRGPVGCPFVSFGNVRDITTQAMATQQRSFVVYNRGPLNGMVVVRVKATAKDDNVFEKPNIVIWPPKCVIGPDSFQQISVTFAPRRNDLKKLLRKQSPVITIAMLEVIYGDDPNRQRIASLIGQLQSDATFKPLDFLLNDFVNEQPVDFTDFNESTKNVNDLFSAFKSEEIALTLDRCTLNETAESEVDLMMTGLDETMMFRTLMPVEAASEPTGVNRTGGRTPVKAARNSWSVRPRQMFMNPFGAGQTQTLVIRNDLMTPQTFELVANFRHLLECRPESGTIQPGEEVQVQVKMRKVFVPDEEILLGVFIENDKIDVLINVDRTQH